MKGGTFIIVGKPNVGKSTLFNLLIKEKISITSSKAHTTKQTCTSIARHKSSQIEYIDTRGYDKSASVEFFNNANAVLLVTTLSSWDHIDEEYLKFLATLNKPIILLINKIDQLHGWKDENVHVFIERLSTLYKFHDLYCVSAKHGHNINLLERTLSKLLVRNIMPMPNNYCAKDNIWRIKEIIREKLFRTLNKELPHELSVEVQIIDEIIYGTIFVNKLSHRKILIGDKGRTLGHVRIQIEKDLIHLLKLNQRLELFVKLNR